MPTSDTVQDTIEVINKYQTRYMVQKNLQFTMLTNVNSLVDFAAGCEYTANQTCDPAPETAFQSERSPDSCMQL